MFAELSAADLRASLPGDVPLAVRNALLAIRRRYGPPESVAHANSADQTADVSSSLRAVFAFAKGDQSALQEFMVDPRKRLDEDMRKLIEDAALGEPCRDAQPSDGHLRDVKKCMETPAPPNSHCPVFPAAGLSYSSNSRPPPPMWTNPSWSQHSRIWGSMRTGYATYRIYVFEACRK